MSEVASLKGSINLATDSLATAMDRVKELHDKLKGLDQVIALLEKANKAKAKSDNDAAKASQNQVKAEKAKADILARNQNLIRNAGVSIGNLNQRIKQNVAEESARNAMLAQVSAQYRQYQSAVSAAEGDTTKLATAASRLREATAAVSRSIREQAQEQTKSTSSAATTERAVGAMTLQYERVKTAINSSALSDRQKSAELAKLTQSFNQAEASLRKYGTNAEQGIKQQNQFRLSTQQVQEAVRKANREFRGQEIESFSNKFRDLTGSVQVALGPLSGVASRMTALAGLFRRNAISIAAVLATTTAYTVSLGRTLSVGAEAERQLLSLNGQIATLGMTSQITADDLNAMAHRIGAATLTSARDAREALQSLLGFRNISVKYFEDILLASQGLATAFGGTLQSNLQRLARLLDDPIQNFDALARRGITFNNIEKERIRVLQESGRLQEAQALIMERFSGVMQAAQDATKGLAGQLDALGDNSALVFERLYNLQEAGTAAAEAVEFLNKAIVEFGESDDALVLAGAFSKTIELAASVVKVFVSNLNAVAVVVAALAGGAMFKLLVVVGRLSLSALGATAAITKMGGATALASRAAATLAARSTLAATAIKGLTAAAGWLGIALQAAFAIGAIYLFTKAMDTASDKVNLFHSNVKRMGATYDRIRTELEQKGEASFVEKELKALEDARAMYDAVGAQVRETASTVETLGDIYDRQAAAARRFNNDITKASRAGDYDKVKELRAEQAVFSEKAAETNRQLELQKSVLAALEAEYVSMGQRVEEAGNAVQAAAQKVSEQDKAIKSLTDSMKENIQMSKDMTDAETQRIEKAKEVLQKLQNNKKAAEENGNVDAKLMQQLDEQIKQQEEFIEAQRKTTQGYRQQQAQLKISADILAELNAMQARTAVYTNATSQADLDAALNAAKREEQVQKNVEALAQLDAATLKATASKLGVYQAGMSEAQMVAAVTQKYREQATALSNAELAAQAYFNMQQQMNELRISSLPQMDSINAKYQQEIAKLEATAAQAKLSPDLTPEDLAKIDADMATMVEYLKGARARAIKELEQNVQQTLQLLPISDTEQLKQDFEQRRAALLAIFKTESEDYKAHLADLENQYKQAKFQLQFTNNAQAAVDVLGGAMNTMQMLGKENSRAYQAMALGQAVIQQAMAVNAAWADPSVPFWAKIATSAMAGAQVAAQIKQIKAQSFSTGGYVSGKGTSTSDSIHARLSDGEYVIRAAAVRMLGVDTLDALNSGKIGGLATGGMVGIAQPIKAANSASGTSINVAIINEGTGAIEATRTEQGYDQNGELQLRVYVRQIVREEMNNGQMDRTMGKNYGLTRQPIRR